MGRSSWHGGGNGFRHLVEGLFQSDSLTTPISITVMRVFQAIGLGVFLLVLSIAMPRVFHSLEETIIALLQTAQTVLEEAETFTASPAQLPVPSVPLVSH